MRVQPMYDRRARATHVLRTATYQHHSHIPDPLDICQLCKCKDSFLIYVEKKSCIYYVKHSTAKMVISVNAIDFVGFYCNFRLTKKTIALKKEEQM